VPFAHVEVSQIRIGTSTDESGQFLIAPIEPGTYELMIQAAGYSVQTQSVSVEAGATTEVQIDLESNRINLDQVVISGTRSEIPLFEAPVVVSRIDNRIYENTQSVTLAEGLAFSPGLRLENNCQNCGFTQLRMNGLDGAYTQVLINSRPVFSALAGVYGLELIPANMVDRVEVVRGGGSALYGGNAIAGTVNVITKDPLENAFSLGLNQAFVDMESCDRTISLNGSVVSKDLNTGLNLYGFNRKRDQWDANGDGFSELTLIENTTFGFDAYHKPSALSRIELNGYAIEEFRRGGNDFDLEPHQSDISEQLDHRIIGGALSYELFSRDYRHKISLYASGQLTERHSYYGGGGRVLSEADELTEEDILAINAYGNSHDVALVGGLQYVFDINPTFTLTAGSEYQYNDVEDRMPWYSRRIDQRVGTVGAYGQLEIRPMDRLTVLAGGRLDFIGIDGVYALNEEQLENESNQTVFVPRASVMYEISPELKIRGSYAQGYRAPQAFDEDLHIETVGGAALFTRLDPNLTTERSDSYTLSLNYAETSDDVQVNYLAEGFYTDLRNPFITANPVELPNGVAVLTKRNGSGARVSGVNLEANMAFREKWILNGGLTLQTAQYDEAEEIWSPESPTDANADSLITASRILRTPDVYGFLSATFKPDPRWSFTYSAIFTGSMQVPHVIDPETEFTVIEETPAFIENNLKVGHTFPINGNDLELFCGMQNIFNSFQDDFDVGPDRDAGYVYGPVRPRTVFFGLKFGLKGE
jgi:outer membrane receptor for ferrienterochelin and colicins